MRLRRFNANGLREFQESLERCRCQPEADIPAGLLEDEGLTEVVSPQIQVAQEQFVTKEEAALYLKMVLSPLKSEEIQLDAGLWSWLALLLFDSICPQTGVKRVVRNDYHYIFEPANNRHFYRHLVYLPWRVIQLAPVHNRLFLKSRMNALDKVNDQVVKRLFLTRIPCIFEVLDRLYWDETRNRPKRGITGSTVRAGDLTHRFPIRIRQLEKTYDLMSLDSDQLIELLGDEFGFARLKPRSKRAANAAPAG